MDQFLYRHAKYFIMGFSEEDIIDEDDTPENPIVISSPLGPPSPQPSPTPPPNPKKRNTEAQPEGETSIETKKPRIATPQPESNPPLPSSRQDPTTPANPRKRSAEAEPEGEEISTETKKPRTDTPQPESKSLFPSKERALYFHRLTSVLAFLQTRPPSSSARPEGLDSEIMPPAPGEKEETLFLNVIALLCTRSNKGVSVLVGGNKAVFMEESSSQDGKVRGAVNLDADFSFSWMDTLGLSIQEVRKGGTYLPKDSTCTFAQHIRKLCLYYEKIKQNYSEIEKRDGTRKNLELYVLRACSDSILTRMSYHCHALREEGSMEEEAPKETTPEVPPADADTEEEQSESSKENFDTDDYSCFFVPEGSLETLERTIRIFGKDNEYQRSQSAILKKLVQNRRFPNESKERLQKVKKVGKITKLEGSALTWVATHFGLACAPNDALAQHQLLSALTTVAISGLAVVSAAMKKEGVDIMDTKSLNIELQRGMLTTGKALHFLTNVIHGKYFLVRHLGFFFGSEKNADIVAGVREWFQHFNRHFTAIRQLIIHTPSLMKICRADVYALESVVKPPPRVEAMEIADFLRTISEKADFLSLCDVEELRTDLAGGQAESDNGIDSHHCELLLINLSILVRNKQYLQHMPSALVAVFRNVSPLKIGISRKSCPVCQNMIEVWNDQIGNTIISSGFHETWVPCALPAWTPSIVAEAVIKKLKSELEFEMYLRY